MTFLGLQFNDGKIHHNSSLQEFSCLNGMIFPRLRGLVCANRTNRARGRGRSSFGRLALFMIYQLFLLFSPLFSHSTTAFCTPQRQALPLQGCAMVRELVLHWLDLAFELSSPPNFISV